MVLSMYAVNLDSPRKHLLAGFDIYQNFICSVL